MMELQAIKTTKRALRRFLLDAQHLLHPLKAGEPASLPRRVLKLIQDLECVQIDPVSAVRPNQQLVLAARLPDFKPDVLNQLLKENLIFEYYANAASIIPMQDYPLFQPVRERLKKHLLPELKKLEDVARGVLRRLEDEGPLPAKAFRSDQRVHGYWDNQNATTKATSHALNLLMDIGEIRVVYRDGQHRLFDLTVRSVPRPLLEEAKRIDPASAREALLEKYLRAYRVFEPGDPRFGWQKMSAKERREAIDQRVKAGKILPVCIAGLKTEYYILAEDKERLLDIEAAVPAADFEEDDPIFFLPPLDNLLWSRKRLADLFDFHYRWEIYTPPAKRQYGYYAMPILAGDRLIGRIDPRLDKKNRRLHVQLLQIEPGVERTDVLMANINRALRAFAERHGATAVTVASEGRLIEI